jgi:biotin carboxyl carrier protein
MGRRYGMTAIQHFKSIYLGCERMSAKIVIPIVGKRGQKYDIVKLVDWKAREGDWIEKGNVVLAVETEKASCEIEAETSGFIHILVQEGEKSMVALRHNVKFG